jgi:hypothetical protein
LNLGDLVEHWTLVGAEQDLVDIHAVRDWCSARGVALRVLSGPLSDFHDLAANDATTAPLINAITAVGRFQRDLHNELTAEGIALSASRHGLRPRGGRRQPWSGAPTGSEPSPRPFSTTSRRRPVAEQRGLPPADGPGPQRRLGA